MEIAIKIAIGLFIFSILLLFFKVTKEFKEKNVQVVQSHDPMMYQEPITKEDEDLVNNIIWEIENT